MSRLLKILLWVDDDSDLSDVELHELGEQIALNLPTGAPLTLDQTQVTDWPRP